MRMCTFSVVFLCDVERVEKFVVVVHGQVDGPRPGLDDGLQIFEHVDVWVRSQLRNVFLNMFLIEVWMRNNKVCLIFVDVL